MHGTPTFKTEVLSVLLVMYSWLKGKGTANTALPCMIGYLGGWTHTHIPTSWTKGISRSQAHASLRTWFKNLAVIISFPTSSDIHIKTHGSESGTKKKQAYLQVAPL